MGHSFRRRALIFSLNYQRNFTLSKPKWFRWVQYSPHIARMGVNKHNFTAFLKWMDKNWSQTNKCWGFDLEWSNSGVELFAEFDFSSVEYSCSSVRQLISLLVQPHGTKGILVLLCNEAIALLSQCSSNMNAMSNANEARRIAEMSPFSQRAYWLSRTPNRAPPWKSHHLTST
jgi:hypothetical protein